MPLIEKTRYQSITTGILLQLVNGYALLDFTLENSQNQKQRNSVLAINSQKIRYSRERAEEMRAKKISSLKKQLAKLERMKFE